jgi:hypothetical protein
MVKQQKKRATAARRSLIKRGEASLKERRGGWSES